MEPSQVVFLRTLPGGAPFELCYWAIQIPRFLLANADSQCSASLGCCWSVMERRNKGRESGKHAETRAPRPNLSWQSNVLLKKSEDKVHPHLLPWTRLCHCGRVSDPAPDLSCGQWTRRFQCVCVWCPCWQNGLPWVLKPGAGGRGGDLNLDRDKGSGTSKRCTLCKSCRKRGSCLSS